MLNAFAITIIFVVVVIVVAGFVRGKRKDKCLKAFSGNWRQEFDKILELVTIYPE